GVTALRSRGGSCGSGRTGRVPPAVAAERPGEGRSVSPARRRARKIQPRRARRAQRGGGTLRVLCALRGQFSARPLSEFRRIQPRRAPRGQRVQEGPPCARAATVV